jgi:hypothetical protein
MICDDHEITNDWNITKEWVENVRAISCGMQVVANGLAAYWAFQAWENNPDLFDQSFVDAISGYLCKSGNVTLNDKNALKNIFGIFMVGHSTHLLSPRRCFWIAEHRDISIVSKAPV